MALRNLANLPARARWQCLNQRIPAGDDEKGRMKEAPVTAGFPSACASLLVTASTNDGSRRRDGGSRTQEQLLTVPV